MSEKRSFISQIKTNPIQVFLTTAAAVGVFLSVANFLILNSIAPLLWRLDRVEAAISEQQPIVQRYIITEERVGQMSEDIEQIKTDVRLLLDMSRE